MNALFAHVYSNTSHLLKKHKTIMLTLNISFPTAQLGVKRNNKNGYVIII
jgi:hypothetical protein